MFLSKVEVIGLGDLISCACDSDRTRRNWKAHVVLWFDMRKLQQSRQRQKGTLSILFNRFHSFFLSYFFIFPQIEVFRSLSGLFMGPFLQSTDGEARNLQYRLLAAADSVCYFVSQRDGMMAHLCIVWVRLRKVLKLQRRRRRSFWKKTRFRFDKDAVPGHQARSPGKPERDWPATVRGHLVIWRWCDCYILK